RPGVGAGKPIKIAGTLRMSETRHKPFPSTGPEQFEITHACSHTHMRVLNGSPQAKQRGIETFSRGLCNDCRELEHKTRALEFDARNGSLVGSDKQIRFGNQIRISVFEELDRHVVEGRIPEDETLDMFRLHLLGQKNAYWWIEKSNWVLGNMPDYYRFYMDGVAWRTKRGWKPRRN
ncbi:hypothetical protein, partial [Methylobacterium soli]|uniref:hypothetical protein n=1 Tax=Methylobacterium soli TaxID=553447 RepID=UPI001EE25ED8